MDFISEVAKNYPPSGIRVMFDHATKYKDVVKLTVGEPNFNTPEHVKKAAIQAIEDNRSKYEANAGMVELREAIARKYTKEFGREYTYENVVVGTGAMEAIVLTLKTFLNPGEEVLISDPAYPNYVGYTLQAHAKPVGVPVYEKDHFKMNPDVLKDYITPKSKILVLNSPSNPLGAVIDRKTVEGLADLALKHNLVVISDEVYDKIIYDGNEHFSMAQIDELKDRVFVINGFSKTYAMTGYRMGYVVGNKKALSYMPMMQESIVSSLPGFIQLAGVAALDGPQDAVHDMVSQYKRRRDITIDGLNDIPGISCLKSPGSFYAFANIKSFKVSSQEFALDLLAKKQVALVPGSAFGNNGEGYIRITFANSDENLIEAVKRIKEYVLENY